MSNQPPSIPYPNSAGRHAARESQFEHRADALSHIALRSPGIFGDDKLIPAEGLDKSLLPIAKSLSDRRRRAAESLSIHANPEGSYGESDGGDVGIGAIAQRAKNRAISAAKEFKKKGDILAAVDAIEEFLTIDSLSSTSAGVLQDRTKAIARSLVADGLATELVVATHNTVGLFATENGLSVPLDSIARSSTALLRVASSLQFSDDFSIIKEENPPSILDTLDTGDLLALAKMEEAAASSPDGRRKIVMTALKAAEVGDVQPVEFVEVLTLASQLGLKEQLSATLSSLRSRRSPGDKTYRINDINTLRLDDVIIELTKKGHLELAQALVSSSPSEPDHFLFALQHQDLGADLRARLAIQLDRLHQTKQAEIRTQLHSKNVPDNIIEQIINSANDPDSAVGIPEDFWLKLVQSPSLTKTLISSGNNLRSTAESITAIETAGLSSHLEHLIKNISKLEDSNATAKYLNSLNHALALSTSLTEYPAINSHDMLMVLVDFKDPAAAVNAAKTLFGTEEGLVVGLKLLRSMTKEWNRSSELSSFRPEDIAALSEINSYLAGIGNSQLRMEAYSDTILEHDNPSARAKSIIEGLSSAGIVADTGPILLSEIIYHQNPADLGRAIATARSSFEGFSTQTYQLILSHLIRSTNPSKAVNDIILREKELQKRQLSLEGLSIEKFSELIFAIGSMESEKELDVYCFEWKVKSECESAFRTYLQPVLESGDIESVDAFKKPGINYYPELTRHFENLGMSSQLTEKLLESWSTYNALGRMLKNEHRPEGKLSKAEVAAAIIEQGDMLISQARALTIYLEAYGAHEVVSIVKTFGIHNFARYSPEQLHNQLQSWQSGEVLAKNIVVSALSDWNGALFNAGKDGLTSFTEEGLFCFEVGEQVQLAKVAVAVGNRDRAMGRYPIDIDGVENFIINGHANPGGIILGPRKEQRLLVADYIRNPLSGVKANNYMRHLGTNFRVILQACSTAGEVKDGMNIAEAISRGHKVEVVGSDDTVQGGVVIEKDGTVTFNRAKGQTVVLGQQHRK